MLPRPQTSTGVGVKTVVKSQNCCQESRRRNGQESWSLGPRLRRQSTLGSDSIGARMRLYWRRSSTGLPGPDVVPWVAADPRGRRGELVALIGAEMREEQPLQSSDVVVLRLLEFLDPFGGDRDF